MGCWCRFLSTFGGMVLNGSVEWVRPFSVLMVWHPHMRYFRMGRLVADGVVGRSSQCRPLARVILVYVILVRAWQSIGESSVVNRLTPFETIELQFPSTSQTQLISRSYDCSIAPHRPVSSANKSTRHLNFNELCTLPDEIFDGLESLTELWVSYGSRLMWYQYRWVSTHGGIVIIGSEMGATVNAAV